MVRIICSLLLLFCCVLFCNAQKECFSITIEEDTAVIDKGYLFLNVFMKKKTFKCVDYIPPPSEIGEVGMAGPWQLKIGVRNSSLQFVSPILSLSFPRMRKLHKSKLYRIKIDLQGMDLVDSLGGICEETMSRNIQKLEIELIYSNFYMTICSNKITISHKLFEKLDFTIYYPPISAMKDMKLDPVYSEKK